MRRLRLRVKPKYLPLSNDEILRWADEWFTAHGHWPNINSGLIPGTIDDTWRRIDDALRQGYRELPKKSGLSLARLLERHRRVRNSEYPPKLSVPQIVKWARQHHERTGIWPTANIGPIDDAPGESWMAIDMSLRKGRRDVGPGSSLAQLLTKECGVPNCQQRPPLTVALILRWADEYHARHGKRPTRTSGMISGSSDETWMAIHRALASGRQGFPGGSSLAKLLNLRRAKWESRKS